MSTYAEELNASVWGNLHGLLKHQKIRYKYKNCIQVQRLYVLHTFLLLLQIKTCLFVACACCLYGPETYMQIVQQRTNCFLLLIFAFVKVYGLKSAMEMLYGVCEGFTKRFLYTWAEQVSVRRNLDMKKYLRPLQTRETVITFLH